MSKEKKHHEPPAKEPAPPVKCVPIETFHGGQGAKPRQPVMLLVAVGLIMYFVGIGTGLNFAHSTATPPVQSSPEAIDYAAIQKALAIPELRAKVAELDQAFSLVNFTASIQSLNNRIEALENKKPPEQLPAPKPTETIPGPCEKYLQNHQPNRQKVKEQQFSPF